MHEGLIIERIDAVLGPQAKQRRSVTVIIILLQSARRQAVYAKQADDIERYTLVDLRPDLRLVRI